MSQMQTTPFQPTTMYDAPGMALSQILSGNLTSRGLWNDFFNQDALSPKERESIASRMRAQAGDNPVTSVLLETAMNPWVWAAFVTSPLGGRALGGALKGVHEVAPEFSAWVRKSGAITHMGGYSPHQVLGDAGSATVFHDIGNVIDRMHQEEAGTLNVAALMKKLGVSTLDHTEIQDASKAAEVRKLMDAVYIRKTGLDTVAKQPIAGAAPTVPAVFDRNAVDVTIGSVGQEAQDYLMGIDRAIKQRAIRNSGVENAQTLASLEFKSDATKSAAVHFAGKRQVLNQGIPSDVQQSLMGAGLVPDDVVAAAQRGEITPERFQEIAGAEIEARMGDYYFPRNQRVLVGGESPSAGTWADTREQKVLQRTGQAVRPGSSLMVRDRPVADLHPDELRRLESTFGLAQGEESQTFYREWLNTQDKKLAEAAGGNTPTYFEVINPDKALRKHFDQTALTYALHAAPISDTALFAQKAHYEKVAAAGLLPEMGGARPKTFEPSINGTGSYDILKPFLDDEAGSMAPAGRWTNADMIYQDFVASKDVYTQKLIGHHLIPTIAGMRPEKTVVRAAMIQAKALVNSAMGGITGNALEEAGPTGQYIRRNLSEWSNDDVLLKDADQVSRHVAEYFTMTHQGFNPVSMVTNGMQMFTASATRYGLVNTLKAYGQSVKGMVGYLGERFGQGFKEIDDLEKMQLIQKHMPFTAMLDEAGLPMNLTSIGPNPFELTHGVASGRPMRDLEKTKWQKLVGGAMGGFEKIEWMNRSTTAGAVMNRMKELGIDVASREGRAMALGDIRRGVMEADYPPSMMNTPMAFQSNNPELGGPLGPVLSNPIMRQYLPFVYRSTVGQFLTGPTFGESARTWGLTGITTKGRLPATIHDFMRMMAISGLVYSVGKATVDADLSRGLGFNAAIGLLGTEKMGFGQSPMYLPPAVDVPVQLAWGISTGDMTRIQQSIPRLIPAGVAMARFASILPEQSWIPKTSGMQKTYADWNKPNQEGLVPFFKGDGTLIGYEEPRALVMKAMGADLGAFQKAGAFDRFVLKNQQEIMGYRRQATAQLIGGDMNAYEGTRQEFAKRFGVPLVITKEQLQSAVRLREVPRPERMLDRLPGDVRGKYLEMAAATDPSRYGMTPAALTGGSTSGMRGPRSPNVALTPEALQAVSDAVAAQHAQPVGREAPFTGFTGFGR